MANYTVRASITRPANTTPYTAGDVVGATAAAIELPNFAPAHSLLILVGVTLEIDVTAIPSGMTTFRAHFYSATPPSALADNAAWDLATADRTVYRDYVDLEYIVDHGNTLFTRSGQVAVPVRMGASTSLFMYLVTNGAFTPTSAAVKVLTVHAVGT